ncbi:hypothetical protein C8039_14145 [Halogeometricum sp. wsp3]|nr:hypothetical protein C8039_14145 [Halogeometricum sp. wsp3]
MIVDGDLRTSEQGVHAGRFSVRQAVFVAQIERRRDKIVDDHEFIISSLAFYQDSSYIPLGLQGAENAVRI